MVAFALREAAAADSPPVITESPANVSTTAGGVASFRVVANGTAPLTYQWFHDARPLAGASGAILIIDQLGALHDGGYSARVSNSTGAATSAAATLTVQPLAFTPIGDPTFRGDSRLDGTPTAILQLTDGRVLVADGLKGKLVRLLADGRFDPAFVPGAPHEPFAASETGFIRQLVEQPDGRILAAGYFADYQDVFRPGLVRINSDGTVDTGFVPAIDLSAVPPSFRSANEVLGIALQPDGKILVHDGNRRLVRLFPDGQRDNGFSPAILSGGVCGAFALATDGRIYVAVFAPPGIARLLPDGSEDPSFARRPVDFDAEARLFALGDGKLLVSTGKASAMAIPGTHVFPIVYATVRWLADGSVDSAFPSLAVLLRIPPARDGSIFFPDGTLINPDGSKTLLNLGLPPYDTRGATPGYLPALAPDGRIYLSGFFAFYNGVTTSRVVRLNRVAATATVAPAAPRLLTAWSESATVAIGQTVVFHAAAIGPGPLTYQWSRSNGVSVRTPAPEYAFVPGYLIETGDWTVRVLNAAGEVASQPFNVTVQPATLRIVEQPNRVLLATGRKANLQVTFAHGSTPANGIWQRNGVVLPTTRNPDSGYPVSDVSSDLARLDLGLAAPAMAGTYTVTVTNALGQSLT
ncbi:MAG: hypothetical protein HY736_27650, partial [Verrucomicrobia bacterium]|nr:hypothetical protein [Verrucomicrobiota bacterium]